MVETGVELDNKSIIVLSRCLVGLLFISQVENLLLEVLTANFRVQQSVRAIVSNNSFHLSGFAVLVSYMRVPIILNLFFQEISLGILGNLACHEALMKRIISTNGLIDLIVNQLSLDDTQCLCEACR